MLRKISLALIIFISILNFGLPIDEVATVPNMIVYEFRIVDISADMGSNVDLEKLTVASGNAESDYLSLIPVTDSSGKLIFSLKNIFAELSHSVSEEYYHLEAIPEIVTTMGNPGSLSVQRDKFNIPENTYTNEIVMLSVLPEREDIYSQIFSRVNLYIAGKYSVRLTTKIKHKENEWVPVALVRFSYDKGSESISGESENSANRYTVLFLRARNIALNSETQEKELLVWSDMSGLDELFSPATKRRAFQNNRIEFLFAFDQLGLTDFSGELAITVTEDFFLGAELGFDTRNSSMSSLGLSIGVTGEDGLLLRLLSSYGFTEAPEKKVNLSLGFEDSTQPTELLKLSAAWYPLVIYPFEAGEDVVELANRWSFEAAFIGKTGIMFSSKINGDPVPNKISAKIGYSTESFEFSVGFSFELSLWE